MTITSLPTQYVDPVKDKPRFQMLLMGPGGIGKTTFITKLPNHLILVTEPGDDFKRRRPLKLETFKDFIDVVDLLITQKHDIEWLGIDTLDKLWALGAEQVCQEEGIQEIGDAGYGSGYAKVNDLLRAQAYKLHYETKINVVWTAHTKIVEEPKGKGETKKKIVPSLSPSTLNTMNEFITSTVYLGIRANDNGDFVRSLHFASNGNLEYLGVKDRSKRFPEFIDVFDDDSNSDIGTFLKHLDGPRLEEQKKSEARLKALEKRKAAMATAVSEPEKISS